MEYSNSTIIEEKIEITRQVNREKVILKEKDTVEPTVGKIHDADDYLRDNEYIHSGYRINFNTKWKIFKSLFVLHNEFVNVWSHILGAIFVVILIIYTALYIKTHKLEIMVAIDNKLDSFNEEWNNFNIFKNITNDIKHTYEESKEFVQEYASRVKNKTADYFNTFDETINEYKQYFQEKINCIECIKLLVEKVSLMKESFGDNLEEFKKKIKNLYQENIHFNMTQIEHDFVKYVEELNEKLHHFKQEIVDRIDSDNFDVLNEIQYDNFKRLRTWPLFVFLFSAIMCLGCSATFHLCFVHSEAASIILGKLDYAGISFLIAGSCFPPYYYLFYCSTLTTYLTFISILALAVLICSLRKDFGDPDKRGFRGFLFLSLGVSAGLPILHLILFSHTIPGFISQPTLVNWIVGGLFYVGGCLIYINRFPEKIWPGRFCIWV